jgi:hypothetical protein
MKNQQIALSLDIAVRVNPGGLNSTAFESPAAQSRAGSYEKSFADSLVLTKLLLSAR